MIRDLVTTRPLTTVCSIVALFIFAASFSVADEPVTEVEVDAAVFGEPEVIDIGFEVFCQSGVIKTAVQTQDINLLTDVALATGHGEKILMRERNDVTATMLTSLAIQTATSEGDKEALARLEKGIKEYGIKGVEELMATAMQLADHPRALTMPPGLSPKDVTPESMVLYHSMMKEISKARGYGMSDELKELADSVDFLPLHPKQQQHLRFVTGEALASLDKDPVIDSPLTLLASNSRAAKPAVAPAPKVVRPPVVRMISGPSRVKSLTKNTYTVVLSAVSKTPVKVTIKGTYLTVPASITIPANKISGTFVATTPKVTFPVIGYIVAASPTGGNYMSVQLVY